MKGSLMLGALCAIGAVASPVEKRAMVTDVELTIVTVTVTDSSVASSTTTSVKTNPSPKVLNEVHQKQPEYSWPPWPITTEVPTTTVPTTTVEPSTTVLPPSTTSTSVLPSSTGDAYQSMLLDSHNIHRSNHSAPALVWNETLAESALALANTCDYHHDTSLGPATNYGQNIAYGVDSSDVNKIITDMMYNDEMMYYQNLYGQADPDMTDFEHWGHFSQIVWLNTASVGCATVTCQPLAESSSNDALPFTVCNYFPAGNYGGEYADNVLQPQGEPIAIV